MMVRVVIGVGLFTLGYLLGKEIGRAQSFRDQFRNTLEDEDEAPTELASGRQTNSQAHRATDQGRSPKSD